MVRMAADETASRLTRRLGLAGATAVGLGAMLGTGVFAAWTPALLFAGDQLLIALVIAAVVASLNAWSSVRLAAAHPVSGGSYAYGRRWLGRGAGVTAGVAFVVGKSASAGAAALTIGAYLAPEYQRWIALAAVAIMLAVDLVGVKFSAAVTGVLSVVVIAVLVWLVWRVTLGINTTVTNGASLAGVNHGLRGLLEASAVLFVAFAGYARVTVLGEEVRQPRRNIPRAVAVSLAVTLVLYVGVGFAVLLASNAGIALGRAPLSDIAAACGPELLASVVPVAAVIAAGTALMSLIAGLGRTIFAMADEGDAPRRLAAVSARKVPVMAELAAVVLVLVVVAAGGIAGALALSAGSIGIYYAVAHLSALRMGSEGRPPLWVPISGLVGCLTLVVGALLAISAG